MSTKLTLTIEQAVIEKAKIYARESGHSLSHIIENFLKVITKEDLKSEIGVTPLVKSLQGSFKSSTDFNYKEELSKALTKKYR